MLSSVQWSCIQHLIAYEMCPPDERLSHDDFCQSIGINRRTMEKWQTYDHECECGAHKESLKELRECGKCGGSKILRKPMFPEFCEALDSARKEATDTHDFYALRTRQWALEQLRALYGRAKTTNEKRQILKQIRDETQDVASQSKIVDFTHLPDEELERLMLNQETDSQRAFEMTIAGEVSE